MATIEEGQTVLRRIADKLGDTRQLRADYAKDLLRQAQRNAVRRPTPQARMTAQGMRQRGGAVLGFPGTRVFSQGFTKPMGGFSFGSEFGSDTHRQFGPRNESGYWLNPAADQIDDTSGEKWLDNVLSDSLRGIH